MTVIVVKNDTFENMLVKTNNFWFKRIAIAISFVIVTIILWNTYILVKKIKKEERSRVEIFAEAIKEFESNTNPNASFNLEVKIFEEIKDIPIIHTNDKDSIIDFRNLDSVKLQKTDYLRNQLELMKAENKPIHIKSLTKERQYLYYRNSDLLYKLKYYPIALIFILLLFSGLIYLLFSANKVSEQNKLWTGMAKETAHQIGTPLSSLLGWVEILRIEEVDENYVKEIEKDIHRLNVIANRFSKIGSVPELKRQDVVVNILEVFKYFKNRSSEQINFMVNAPDIAMNAMINKELFGWVIENLIKNAIDAMKGKGEIELKIKQKGKKIQITISDTGKGIPKAKHKEIFRPGFTTKKRGWGLGLSLSKRIIEDYHKGKIFVKKSQVGKGTIFEINLQSI